MNPLQILMDPRVAERTSAATRKVLEERATPAPYQQFLNDEHLEMLRALVDAMLPQNTAKTNVNIAEAIDRRLASGKNAGFRYAVLPPDGEAYRQGLTIFFEMLKQTPMTSFDRMPSTAREEYIRRVCNGDVDGPAQFPLSTFMRMVRSDAVRFWMAHPQTMEAVNFYGFADGATGNEGWREIGPNSSAPFELEPADAALQEAGAR